MNKFIALILLTVSLYANANNCDHLYPYGKPEVTATERVTYLCRLMYVVEHSPSRKTPYWSAEKLMPQNMLSHEARVNAFKADPDLPKSESASPADYERTGYDKGHMSPVGNMHASKEAMLESFYMSNMVPQSPGNNRVGWRVLEDTVRDLVPYRGDLFVITGPIYDGRDIQTIGRNKVAVPTRLYKIVVDPSQYVAMSFIVPNAPISASELPYAIVKIADVEEATGIKFFPLLPTPLRDSTMIWTALTSD